MAESLAPRSEQSGPILAVNPAVHEEFHVSELAAELVGASAPFGNIDLPLPLERLNYVHPGPADRPHLAPRP